MTRVRMSVIHILISCIDLPCIFHFGYGGCVL